jgi:hypothetical protein
MIQNHEQKSNSQVWCFAQAPTHPSLNIKDSEHRKSEFIRKAEIKGYKRTMLIEGKYVII